MVLITIVNGVYKPTYNWGAPHCIYIYMYITQGSFEDGSWGAGLRLDAASPKPGREPNSYDSLGLFWIYSGHDKISCS